MHSVSFSKGFEFVCTTYSNALKVMISKNNFGVPYFCPFLFFYFFFLIFFGTITKKGLKYPEPPKESYKMRNLQSHPHTNFFVRTCAHDLSTCTMIRVQAHTTLRPVHVRTSTGKKKVVRKVARGRLWRFPGL